MGDAASNTVREHGEACPLRQIAVKNAEIDSRELFQAERQLLIRHGAEVYRLRVTRQNKLILTK